MGLNRTGWRLLAALMAPVLFAATPHSVPFEVIDPAQIDFNWPDPPKEGAANYFHISENGEARCIIVHPEAATQYFRWMASRLAGYLEGATGAAFRVIPESRLDRIPAGMGQIHLGNTAVALEVPLKLPDLHYGRHVFPNLNGFEIRTLNPSQLLIRGPSDEAMRYGIVGLLTHYVGIRQYWLGPGPGAIGEVFPDKPTLSLPELVWQDWPYWMDRWIGMQGFAGGPVFDFSRRNWHPQGPILRTRVHNYSALLPPEVYGETHPEFYPEQGGARRVPPPRHPNGWQPCVSNPDVADIMAEAIKDFFRRNPTTLGKSLALNDGRGDCECAECRALDAPDADYAREIGLSDRYLHFTNRIAAKVRDAFPDRYLFFLAYATAHAPPRIVQPADNVLVCIATRHVFNDWDGWMAAGARHMGLYLHHLNSWQIMPRMDIRQQARRLRYAVASGRARLIYTETRPQWPFNGILGYILGELTWDPRLDVEDLIADYYQGLYGPASDAMREWHAIVEGGYERWLNAVGEPHPFAKDIRSPTGTGSMAEFDVLLPDEAAAGAAALDAAAATPGLDDRQRHRIDLVQAMFGLQRMGAEHHAAKRRLRHEPVDSLDDARRVVADARQLAALSREMSDYIKETLEAPALADYALFREARLYRSLRSGTLRTGAILAIQTGVRTAAEALRDLLGDAQAGQWWALQAADETHPALLRAFDLGERIARRLEPEHNLIDDGGFEQMGQRRMPDLLDPDFEDDIDIRPDPIPHPAGPIGAGVFAWHPGRTPFRVALSRETVRSGDFSLRVESFRRAQFSRTVRIDPEPRERRFRGGMWVHRNALPGRYTLEILRQTPDDFGQREIRAASLALPAAPDEWHAIMIDFVVPPDTARLVVRLRVDEQAEGAACWIDDVFLGEYPEGL